jgi:hypothetical protein
MEVKAIQKTVKQRYKYKISYGKAWRAKQKVLETQFGSFFDSYDSVGRMLHTLQERNPGTYVDIQDWRDAWLWFTLGLARCMDIVLSVISTR